MSDEDKQQIIGRLVSDRSKAREELELIKADLHRIGMALYTIGERAKTYDFNLARRHYQSYGGTLKGDLENFGKRLAEYDSLAETVRQLEEQLQRLGICSTR